MDFYADSLSRCVILERLFVYPKTRYFLWPTTKRNCVLCIVRTPPPPCVTHRLHRLHNSSLGTDCGAVPTWLITVEVG